MSNITLFHGTDHIIEVPDINIGNEHNDYGKGFYCTDTEELAKEWACKQNTDGFVNHYELNTNGLKTLDLTDDRHTVLNWIAILLKYRTFKLSSEIAVDAREYIIDHYSVNISDYDIAVGYRADDSYFQYAESFVSNGLPLRTLNKALKLGRLGVQTVLVSQKAFDQIRFIDAVPVSKKIYYPKFIDRDSSARRVFKEELKGSTVYRDDIFVLDILREEMQNDDPRIQRIISE